MEPAGAVAAVHAGAAACRHRRACRAPLAPPRARHRCRNAGGRRERRALMFAYRVRRALYAIPVLIGVNLLTFVLFFVVNSPDDMARMQVGVKRATPEAIERWKAERGYDKPMFFNAAAAGRDKFTDTIFFDKSLRMFALEFGRADDGRDIGQEIRDRMGPSLAIALPTFALGLAASISFALLLVFFRATALDFWGVVLC